MAENIDNNTKLPDGDKSKPDAPTVDSDNDAGSFTDVYGNKIKQQYTEKGKKESEISQLQRKIWMDNLNKTRDMGTENWDESKYLSEEQIKEIYEQIAKLQEEVSKMEGPGIIMDPEQEKMLTGHSNSLLSSWDPRLSRLDYFMMSDPNNTASVPRIVPFASTTAASAFMDFVFTAPTVVVDQIIDTVGIKNKNDYSKSKTYTEGTESGTQQGNTSVNEKTNENTTSPVLQQSVNPRAAKPLNETAYEENPVYYGVASLMNPYSITKLMGGLDEIENKKGELYTTVKRNYMYDIRDQRRFYGQSVDGSTNLLAVSMPTISNIIKWANSDKWGRTPYTFADFMYCTWYGIIPNNRLLTLRRYIAPTYDNLQFDGMWNENDVLLEVKSAKTGESTDKRRQPVNAFAPRCTLVGYCGDGTGNNFSDILKFTTGIPWEEVESKIWDVNGSQGEEPQAVIDKMFDGGNGFSGGGPQMIRNLISKGNLVTTKILSFGKFTGALNNNYGMDQEAFKNATTVQVDPYDNGPYANRVQGPLNRIDKLRKRKAGITFEQSFTLKFQYKARAYGNINPKAAMLDIIANALEMVSPEALFWGGGHKFMITPQLYPYHDGGWRDSFMKKLYQGKIFGKSGAIDNVFSGIKSLGTDSGGNFQWSKITDGIGQFIGQGLSMIGSALSGIASSLLGDGAADFIKGASNKATDAVVGATGGSKEDADAAKKKGDEKMNKLLGNLEQMWRNKAMASTMMPEITGMNSLLLGEPIGEWHLTVGNPLNPIAVIGNLICEKVDVECSNVLGPDDFPEDWTFTYTLQHAMPRDKGSIQSMFNRGMGKIYELPDYIKGASDFETKVDHYTGGVNFRSPAFTNGPAMLQKQLEEHGYSGINTYKTYKVQPGSTPSNSGNPNTSLITKFTPATNLQVNDIVGNGVGAEWGADGAIPNIPIIKALAISYRRNS